MKITHSVFLQLLFSKFRMLIRLVVVAAFLTLMFPALSYASACCGGGVTGPALITGDDKALISQSVLYSQIHTDVEASGIWRKRDETENLKSITLQASHVFWDRWQAGLAVPLIERSRSNSRSGGAGDLSLNVGYEYLTDWDYHPIRPKAVGYLQLTAPTGQSIQESDSRFQLEARGRGFWALGLGTMLTKNLTRWDLFSSFDLHRSFEKQYSNTQGSGKLKPGFGGAMTAGAGFHLSNYRLGSSLTWNYEDPVAVEGSSNSDGSMQRFVTAAISLTRQFENEWSLTGQISDQSLIGSPSNTTLSQSVSVQLQKRWLR